MAQALFSFETRAAAQRAMDHVIGRGLPPAAVALHVHEHPAEEGPPGAVDEFWTGGFVRNMMDLFQGVFDWPATPQDPEVFAEALRHGGAVLSVRADEPAERETVDAEMRAAGCNGSTPWAG